MRVFLTGGTGFIGGWVLKALLDRGFEVVLISRSGTFPPYPPISPDLPVIPVKGDLSRKEDIVPHLEGCERIYHLAGWISTRKKDTEEVFRSNYTTTLHLWDLAVSINVKKVVYLASIFTLGGGSGIVNEEGEKDLFPVPVPYVEAKRSAQRVTEWYEKEKGLPVVYLYPTFCVGPGDLRLSSTRFFWLYMNFSIPFLFSGGWNLVDVRDVAEGIVEGGERLEVGSRRILAGENFSFLETLRILDEMWGIRSFRIPLPPRIGLFFGKVGELFSLPYVDEGSAWMASRNWYYDGSMAIKEGWFRSRPIRESFYDTFQFFLEKGMVRKSRRDFWEKRLSQGGGIPFKV
jgi:dihydroflavonol-4-reductase